MEFGPRRDAAGQLGFDIHVDVLEHGFPAELACLDLPGDGIEAAEDGLEFAASQEPSPLQHGGMSFGPEDVVPP